MTLVLSIAQCRALVRILEEVDDREVTMYQDTGVLVVDPSDPRGRVIDDRMYYIAPNGTVSNEWVRPIATPDLEVITPPADEEVEEFKCETCDDTEPHAHADPEPEVVDPDVVAPSSTDPAVEENV